jgi:hypothetical protein
LYNPQFLTPEEDPLIRKSEPQQQYVSTPQGVVKEEEYIKTIKPIEKRPTVQELTQPKETVLTKYTQPMSYNARPT